MTQNKVNQIKGKLGASYLLSIYLADTPLKELDLSEVKSMAQKSIDSLGEVIDILVPDDSIKLTDKQSDFLRHVMDEIGAKYTDESIEIRKLLNEKVSVQTGGCDCGNPQYGFDCSCKWVEMHPGDIEYHCEYCGLYKASAKKCDKCEEDRATKPKLANSV